MQHMEKLTTVFEDIPEVESYFPDNQGHEEYAHTHITVVSTVGVQRVYKPPKK